MKVGMGKPGNQSRNCPVTIFIFIFRKKLQLHVRSRRAPPSCILEDFVGDAWEKRNRRLGRNSGALPFIIVKGQYMKGLISIDARRYLITEVH